MKSRIITDAPVSSGALTDEQAGGTAAVSTTETRRFNHFPSAAVSPLVQKISLVEPCQGKFRRNGTAASIGVGVGVNEGKSHLHQSIGFLWAR